MPPPPRYVPYPQDLHYLSRLMTRLRDVELAAHNRARDTGDHSWRTFGDRAAARRKQIREHVSVIVELPLPRTARRLTA